jgi:hypothetical protein
MYSPFMQLLGAPTVAFNGGDPVPAGPEGYTVKYFAGAIDAGQAGKFDLLISNQSQQLADSANLSEGGIEPKQSQTFLFRLPSGLPARLIDFVRGPHSSSGDIRASDSTMVARLETGRKTQLLRGIFPANRQNRFLRDCFSVLDSSTLLREPAPPPQPEPKTKDDQDPPSTDDKPKPAATPRTPDLLTERLSGQAPCTLIESPRGRHCYVVSAGKHLPLSQAQFDRSRPLLLNGLARDNHKLLVRGWLNSDSIRSRTGYRNIQAQQDTSTTDQPTTQAPDEDSP